MDEVTARISEITSAAADRMKAASYSPHQVYAEIMFMTDDEVIEIHKLKMTLCVNDANAARERIQAKISRRRYTEKQKALT